MKKTAPLICTCLISLGLLAGCASNQPATGDRDNGLCGPRQDGRPRRKLGQFCGRR